MPNGNRKENLSTRLARCVTSGIVPAVEIPGSIEWAMQRDPVPITIDSESFFENYTAEQRKHYSKMCIPRTIKNTETLENEKFIDNINDWVDENGWQYVEGGEFDGCWVNPQYPNRIFHGNSVTLPITNGTYETAVFPVSSCNDDALGLALHFEVLCAGTKMNIVPNGWKSYDSTRKGRKQVRSNKRKARCQKRGEQYGEAYKIVNPEKRAEAIATLKAKFHMEDVKRDHINMGIETEV